LLQQERRAVLAGDADAAARGHAALELLGQAARALPVHADVASEGQQEDGHIE
jgi:hypothetical protein